MKYKTTTLTASALVLAVINTVYAQDKTAAPVTASPPSSPASTPTPGHNFFTEDVVNAFTKGKFDFNARLRYEYADQQNLESSQAFTIRSRFGFTTAPLYGFQGMLQAQNTTSLAPESDYNAAFSNGQANKTVIADPPVTDISQAWLSYDHWDSLVKGGRQRIVLDNARFVGDVGWRQNMQTFDAASFENKSVKDVTLYYAYVWEVHRVFGNVNGLPAKFRDFDSNSHLINLSYSGCPYGKFTVYSYLLDFANSPPNSSATVGGSFAGAYTFDADTNAKVDYHAEYAYQTDYGNQPLNYHANYYNVELGGEYRRFNAGVGYEVLGSDNGNKGFATPLATLHAFDGWDDVFLNTPNAGLHDLHAYIGAKLPWNVPVRFIYHKFDSDSGSTDFGQEFDAVALRKFGKNWTALVKYAYYDARNAAPPSQATPENVQKFWAQVEFNF